MKALLIFTLLFSLHAAFAQESLKSVKAIRITDVSALLSVSNDINTPTRVSDFRKMYPGSALLKYDLSGYTQDQRIGSSLNTGFSFFAGASFKFANKARDAYRPNIRLRTGLSLNSFQLYSLYQQKTTKSLDSIYPSIFVDSVSNRSYEMSHYGTQLRADVSFLWSTNQEKRRIAIYTGLGISAGISIISKSSVSYSIYRDVQLRDAEPRYDSYTDKTLTTYENFRGPTNYGISAYVPLGVDLRLGNKRSFWKRSHIYYELKPMYNLLIVPGARTFSNFGIQHGWGLRFTV